MLFQSKIVPLNTVIDKEKDSELMKIMKKAIAKMPITYKMLKDMTEAEIKTLQWHFAHGHDLTFAKFEDLCDRMNVRLNVNSSGMTLVVNKEAVEKRFKYPIWLIDIIFKRYYTIGSKSFNHYKSLGANLDGDIVYGSTRFLGRSYRIYIDIKSKFFTMTRIRFNRKNEDAKIA